MIAVNDVSEEGSGFETGTNRLQLFFRDGERKQLPMMLKDEAARHILVEAAERITRK
jgi:phosphopantothenoylcysteine decarboxylase/phosphopantothenate--cysteine ligase